MTHKELLIQTARGEFQSLHRPVLLKFGCGGGHSHLMWGLGRRQAHVHDLNPCRFWPEWSVFFH